MIELSRSKQTDFVLIHLLFLKGTACSFNLFTSQKAIVPFWFHSKIGTVPFKTNLRVNN